MFFWGLGCPAPVGSPTCFRRRAGACLRGRGADRQNPLTSERENELRERMPQVLKPEAERRRFQRHDVAIETRLRVSVMEYGSATLMLTGTILNLSFKGAKVLVRKLKKEDAPVFLRARRKCSLMFVLPAQTDETILNGEIAWVDMRPDASAYLGIELDKAIENGSEILGHYVDTLF